LLDWRRDDDSLNLISEDDSWDSNMMCYPGICETPKGIFLLYNGNEFGKKGFGAAALER
jgi:hypothetical protein